MLAELQQVLAMTIPASKNVFGVIGVKLSGATSHKKATPSRPRSKTKQGVSFVCASLLSTRQVEKNKIKQIASYGRFDLKIGILVEF